jgi:hypothetical protein
MDKQAFFESENALENAEVMLDVCREEYERAGRQDAVQALYGLDVKSAASAQLALLTVQSLPIVPEVADVRRYTLRALEHAFIASKTPRKLAS